MRRKEKNQRRRRLFIKQRLMGLGLIAVSAVGVWICARGMTIEERDCTFLLFTLPVGLTLLFSRNLIIE